MRYDPDALDALAAENAALQEMLRTRLNAQQAQTQGQTPDFDAMLANLMRELPDLNEFLARRMAELRAEWAALMPGQGQEEAR